MGHEHHHPERRTRDDRHFDRWATHYDRSPLQTLLFDPVQRSVVDRLVPRLPPSPRVLDIGCGTGRLLQRIKAATPFTSPVGVDRARGMVEATQRLRRHMPIEQGTAEALPHPNSSFDAVVTTLSFHHWADKPTALSEVERVLRPGGLFALADVSIDDLPRRPRSFRDLVARSMADMPALDERNRLLSDAGLLVLEVIPTFHRRWINLTIAASSRGASRRIV